MFFIEEGDEFFLKGDPLCRGVSSIVSDTEFIIMWKHPGRKDLSSEVTPRLYDPRDSNWELLPRKRRSFSNLYEKLCE